MNRRPFIFNLMLSTIFLPIIISLAITYYAIVRSAPIDIFQIQSTTFGLSDVWIIIALSTLPFFLWLWILVSGKWRKPLLTAAVVYVGFISAAGSGIIESHTHPEKRTIHLSGIAGTDVYCNGVHLGQLPLEIRVDELKAKVPVWNSPPEQRWFDDAAPEQMFYTWIPWDDFREERFLASRELSQTQGSRNVSNLPRMLRAWRESLNAHNAECRFWWSFRFGDSQQAFRAVSTPYSLHRPFDKNPSYYFSSVGIPFSPSAGFHAQLLVDVLPELTPEQKADWDRHVLKHWPLIQQPLAIALHSAARQHNRIKNDHLAKLYETALHSTARLKYHYSDPITESEARRLLADWVHESIEDRLFSFSEPYVSFGEWSATPMVDGYALPLIQPHLAESMRIPLAEQWKKNKYRFENGWAPLAYFAGLDKSPDYFNDMARYSATTHNARVALLENKSPQTTALFRTSLYRRPIYQLLARQIKIYPDQIDSHAHINNPLVEPVMRHYIETAFSDPNHNEGSRQRVNTAAFQAILLRTFSIWDGIDKDELATWIASLPMDAASKNYALRMLRIHREEGLLTFADRLQQALMMPGTEIQTDLTLDDLTNWFDEHPEGHLQQFLTEMEESIAVSNVGSSTGGYVPGMLGDNIAIVRNDTGQVHATLPFIFVTALLRSDTAEGDPQVRALIRRIWNNDTTLVASAVRGTTPINVQRWAHNNAASNNVPEYILELFFELDDPNILTDNLSFIAQTLALSASPKAGEILEKWSNMGFSAWSVNRQISLCLEIWQIREAMRSRKMEIFEDLIAGRLVPDDLLFEQPPWIWQDGQYVQSAL